MREERPINRLLRVIRDTQLWCGCARLSVTNIFWRRFLVLFITGNLAASNQAAAAPNEALPYPQGLTTPWRTPGIDFAAKSDARPALEAAHKALTNAWLRTPQSLTASIESKRSLPLNTKQQTNKMTAGVPMPSQSPTPLVVEPTWCTIMDRHVLIVTVADAKTNELLGSAHATVPRGKWQDLQESNGLTSLLTSQMTALTQSALSKAQEMIKKLPLEDALHVGLNLEQETTRDDEGSSLCLAMLLEEKLANLPSPGFTVARLLGLDHLALLRNALGQETPPLRRPTRTVVVGWHPPTTASPLKRSLPTTLSLTMRPLETVFGKSIPKALSTENVTLSVNTEERIALDGTSKLESFLASEKKSLLLSEGPQVAKVYRAWVYLDRGRAWGLKMNDRLIAGNGPDEVKGHVVRFFGPEANLSSPRGFPIREGAILYIRKNQKAPKLGLEFRMDPRAYPTPWPPPTQGGKP